MREECELCDLMQWQDAANLSRSLLFRLEPQGSGTDHQESLLSYLIRLSHAHQVSPRLLVKRVMTEQNHRIGQIATKAFFQTLSGTINGLSMYAETFADLLGELTLRSDLGQLTMLPWQGLFPHNGQGLLARRPRWCPTCLHGRSTCTQGTPMPLVWALEPYQVCLIHQVRLESRCHCCGASQDFLPSYPDPGFCRRCRSWLGHEVLPQDTSDFQLWVARAVADIASTKTNCFFKPELKVFQQFLKEKIEKFSDGNRSAFCRAIGLGDYAVSGWLNKEQRPSITQFLVVCHGLGVMPSEIFMGDIQPNKALACIAPHEKPKGRKQCPRPGPDLRLEWKQRIEIELTSNDSKCVADVSKSLNVTRSCLLYWFPAYCKALSNQSRNLVRERSNLEKTRQVAILMKAIAIAKLDRGSISRRKIDLILREYGLTISRPHLRKALQMTQRNYYRPNI